MNPGAPEFWGEGKEKEHGRKTAQVVNQLQRGITNSSFKTDLRTSPETTTEVLITWAKPDHMAIFSPQDAASAAEIAAGTIWAVCSEGKVTIHHAASASTRQIGVVLHG